MLDQCLDGVRVLDLSQYLPGPYAAQILSDLGAGVVKVEPPSGDPMRRLGLLDGDGISVFYKLVNAGKTIVCLDLKSKQGRADFTTLAGRADALIESYRPGVLDRLGLGHEALAGLNPGLVHCALSGYGQSGPYAQRAGHDINYMALGGGLATSGPPTAPAMAHPPTADFAGGMQAALATLAALLRRARSGKGGFLDVSLAESVLAWQALCLTGALRSGHAPERGRSLLNGGAACYGIYRTADRRFVTLGALEPKFWADFCRAVRREDWVTRQWEPLPQEALIGEVTALFTGRDLSHWETTLGPVDCCFQAVLDPAEVPNHPQIRARGLVRCSGGPEPLAEVLFPAYLDGLAPAPRAPFREAVAADVLAAWAGS